MITTNKYTIRKRGDHYTTKIVYKKEEPGQPSVEMTAHIFGATKEEVEEKVKSFIESL